MTGWKSNRHLHRQLGKRSPISGLGSLGVRRRAGGRHSVVRDSENKGPIDYIGGARLCRRFTFLYREPYTRVSRDAQHHVSNGVAVTASPRLFPAVLTGTPDGENSLLLRDPVDQLAQYRGISWQLLLHVAPPGTYEPHSAHRAIPVMILF